MGKNGLGEFCKDYTYRTKESELNTIVGQRAGQYPTINESSTPDLTQPGQQAHGLQNPHMKL